MPPDEARTHRVEFFATILLAVAAVATAWSTFQSTQWRGEQAAQTSRSAATRIQSASASTRAGQLTQIDVATFIQWVDADVAGNTELAMFYRQRFREEFQPAFTAWLATNPHADQNAPKTPFEMPQYQLADSAEATRLEAEAAAQSAAAGDALQRSDDYMLAVVLFAVSLFFAGICTKLQSVR
jgi:hypothetical protein